MHTTLMASTTDTTDLTEREDVQGFMTCQQGIAVARGYLTLSSVMGTLGMPVEQALYAGMAQGILGGACGG